MHHLFLNQKVGICPGITGWKMIRVQMCVTPCHRGCLSVTPQRGKGGMPTRVHLGQDQTPRWRNHGSATNLRLRAAFPKWMSIGIDTVTQQKYSQTKNVQTNLKTWETTTNLSKTCTMKPKAKVCIQTIGLKEHTYFWKSIDLGKHTGQNEHTVILYSTYKYMIRYKNNFSFQWKLDGFSQPSMHIILIEMIVDRGFMIIHIITPNRTQNVNSHPTVCTSQLSMSSITMSSLWDRCMAKTQLLSNLNLTSVLLVL